MTQRLKLRPVNDERDFERVLYEMDPVCVGPTTYFAEIACDTGDDDWGLMLTIWADVNHVVVATRTVKNLENLGLWFPGVNRDIVEVPEEDLEILAQVINSNIAEMSHEAHTNVRASIDETEKALKKLLDVKHMLGQVYLEADNQGKNQGFTITPAMAARVIALDFHGEVRAREVQLPFRMAKVARNEVVCYDENNRPIARIGYDPTRSSGPAWMGLYLIQGRMGVL